MHLPFMVCVEGCETAEEQSDDEVRTSQISERREGKPRVIKQQYLPSTVLELFKFSEINGIFFNAATALTIYGIETT